MSILDELSKPKSGRIFPTNPGPSIGQRISRRFRSAVHSLNSYLKRANWYLSDWIVLPTAVIIICLIAYGVYQTLEFSLGLVEADAGEYSLAESFVSSYPAQLRPILQEAMEDGILTVGEYGEIRDANRAIADMIRERADAISLTERREQLEEILIELEEQLHR